MCPSPILFDSHSFERIDWPRTPDGDYAKRFLLPLSRRPIDAFVPNIKADLYALRLNDTVLPVTVNDTEYDNSYVCSPYTHYASYARQELYLLRSGAARFWLRGATHALALLLKASRFNRAVHVNNWLLSTNLYPELGADETEEAFRLLLARFPQHTIVFRSLCRTINGDLMDRLQRRGFRLVPSRQVYLWRGSGPLAPNAKARWLLKRDYALLDKHGYEPVGPESLKPEDMPRLAELYRALYLDKYSYYNPQFGDAFFELVRSGKLLELHALRHKESGRLDAVLGCYDRGGVMTTPVFGYDTSLPQQTGLYRMLSAVLLDIAAAKGLLLHESSGAAQFKRNRGAVAEIEYSAVYDRHLPVDRRMGWFVLERLLNGVGVPLMEKYKL
ncbi:GNAT family N-acetyltransferase [Paenibacillus flagellatus]|uniref:GNAT family N-acetyltransferase n=1 Tax=Paenibacillus flagellatus TaxID=2211139 RepID=A0A2V5KUE0_9BACL|nr:GNAT family N-acetyltransferase [Paenibacillus flagellatus]PYI55507.1 GNAT family N-acetyltransferase [Paenibacillus flagellatus]